METVYYADDRMTTEEIITELRKINIIYTGGAHAFKIIERQDEEPLVQLVHEDNGQFFISEESFVTSSYWLYELAELCKVTQEIIGG